MVDDLPTGYYLDNFQYLIEFVQNRYTDILSDSETGFCRAFGGLDLGEQRLYVRLISRKGPYFRSDKLHYDEIDDIDHTLHQLIERGFVARNHVESPEPWLHLATRLEVLSHFTIDNRGSKKAELCNEVAQCYNVGDIQSSLPFDLLEPAHEATLRVFRLLFFGNLHQDLTEFVLRDLGISPYESYVLDASGRYFDQRAIVDAVLEAYQIQDLAYAVIEQPDLSLADFAEAYLLDIEAEDAQLSRRYSKILNRVARQLERESCDTLALKLYQQSHLGPARERTTRLLAAIGQPDQALQLCQQITAAPQTEAEFEFAVNFGVRLARKHRLPENGLPAKQEDLYSVENILLAQIEHQGVEATVATWLAENGGVALHVENGLLPGLFGLYFWDIIFAPVRGVFFNPFQRGPVDLFTDQFIQTRRSQIEQRLSELDNSSQVEQRIQNVYREKLGLANHFVMWRTLSPELISLSLECIKPEHLRLIFSRLLRDLKENRSGFPDLAVFPSTGGYEFVEVKGPGDTLQANQKRWLRFFYDNDIPARVVNVSWLP
ncbi:MAG: tetratricopeptide (TPR) repeat protein [Dinoroseobacter sp.]|jgi:tetratricopeptide (TPR) repeat protein